MKRILCRFDMYLCKLPVSAIIEVTAKEKTKINGGQENKIQDIFFRIVSQLNRPKT